MLLRVTEMLLINLTIAMLLWVTMMRSNKKLT